ncbi:hypothetical protein Arub01_14640 [Actinomadura rubrobrunea]|uniref:Uncharacterized protein n=1 Tax=Actinomadura rubrobrunea TaxID=115335 RepID=A0A9W6PRM1_9ACTN|nr:hypothetical protein Arub01_14640 [Actinomadura rubrobrunea]
MRASRPHTSARSGRPTRADVRALIAARQRAGVAPARRDVARPGGGPGRPFARSGLTGAVGGTAVAAVGRGLAAESGAVPRRGLLAAGTPPEPERRPRGLLRRRLGRDLPPGAPVASGRRAARRRLTGRGLRLPGSAGTVLAPPGLAVVRAARALGARRLPVVARRPLPRSGPAVARAGAPLAGTQRAGT